VRSGKGDEDRVTVLPESLVEEIREQMGRARRIYEEDRRRDLPGVAPCSMSKAPSM